MEEDGGDSLFEGMVLFVPSQLDEDQALEEVRPPSPSKTSSSANDADADSLNGRSKGDDSETPTHELSEPLDENLFSDLTLVNQNSLSPPSVPNSGFLEADHVSLGPLARKKKLAASRRIGYARDGASSSSTSNNVSTPDNASSNHTDGDIVVSADSVVADYSVKSQLELLRVEVSTELDRSKKLCASVSASRKDSIRRRRIAAEELSSASSHHRLLESQLQDACEREDFDAAQRISDSLLSSDQHRRKLLEVLREAEANSDAMDSHMHKTLLSLIAAEQQSGSRFRQFANDAEDKERMLLNTSETRFAKEMEEWFSSTAALHSGIMDLEIESDIIEEARSNLDQSINVAVENDRREKEKLCQKKDRLVAELQDLLALVRKKEEEIDETSSKINDIDDRITNVVDGFHQLRLGIASQYDALQSALTELHKKEETLSAGKTAIEDAFAEDLAQGRKIREAVVASEEEARSFDELASLRNSLHLLISKFMEEKSSLAVTEEKLIQEVHEFQRQISATRASLQEMSSTKSTIQQKVSSCNQRMFFIDKRIPELEAGKRVAATARNFGEAARITAEAKSLNAEKEMLRTELEKETAELKKLEEAVENTANQLQESEEQLRSKEKEVAIARYQILKLSASVAKAERKAALDLGDEEEGDLLLAEIKMATAEISDLCAKYDIVEENSTDSSIPSISLELVATLGREELTRLAASMDPPIP